MNTRKLPQELCVDIMRRSICSVRMGAVLVDRHRRIYSWAWNTGWYENGIHAEAHAIRRANRSRLKGSKIFVCGERKSSRNPVHALPCVNCARLLRKYGIEKVCFRQKNGEWKTLLVSEL